MLHCFCALLYFDPYDHMASSYLLCPLFCASVFWRSSVAKHLPNRVIILRSPSERRFVLFSTGVNNQGCASFRRVASTAPRTLPRPVTCCCQPAHVVLRSVSRLNCLAAFSVRAFMCDRFKKRRGKKKKEIRAKSSRLQVAISLRVCLEGLRKFPFLDEPCRQSDRNYFSGWSAL